jgi:hypothetical protein
MLTYILTAYFGVAFGFLVYGLVIEEFRTPLEMICGVIACLFWPVFALLAIVDVIATEIEWKKGLW